MNIFKALRFSGDLTGIRGIPQRTPARLFHRIRWQCRIEIARLKRKHSETVVIGVTGSSGKSTTSALLSHILKSHAATGGQIFQNSFKDIYWSLARAPRDLGYFIAEFAIGHSCRPKDTARFLQPDVAVVTTIGIEHYSLFRSREVVAMEKGYLVEGIRPGGFAVLNADDPHAIAMAAQTGARIVTYGRSPQADYRVVAATAAYPDRLRVELAWKGGTIHLQTRFIGEQFWLAAAAAFACVMELGVPQDKIIDGIASFPGLPGRCEIFETSGGPTFILDTGKAPNETLGLVFDMMGKVQGGTKRIVLGQISDYSGNPKAKYRHAYRAALAVADQVIFVGKYGHRAGASAEDIQQGRYLAFETTRQASDYLRDAAGPGDTILLKGSKNLHLERIAFDWTMEVRCWETYCGKGIECRRCGLYMYDFAEHTDSNGSRNKRRFLDRIGLRTGST